MPNGFYCLITKRERECVFESESEWIHVRVFLCENQTIMDRVRNKITEYYIRTFPYASIVSRRNLINVPGRIPIRLASVLIYSIDPYSSMGLARTSMHIINRCYPVRNRRTRSTGFYELISETKLLLYLTVVLF